MVCLAQNNPKYFNYKTFNHVSGCWSDFPGGGVHCNSNAYQTCCILMGPHQRTDCSVKLISITHF